MMWRRPGRLDCRRLMLRDVRGGRDGGRDGRFGVRRWKLRRVGVGSPGRSGGACLSRCRAEHGALM